MNSIGTGLIDPVTKTAISSDLASLLGDTEAARYSITVSTPTGRTVDDAAGTVAITSDADTVDALRAEVTLREIQAAAGGLQLGDIRYHVLASSLSSIPSLSSVVVDGTDRRRVISVSQDPLGLLWTLTARRIP